MTSPVRVGHPSRADLGQLRQCREGHTAGIKSGKARDQTIPPSSWQFAKEDGEWKFCPSDTSDDDQDSDDNGN